MAIDLTQAINDQLNNRDIQSNFIFKINGVDLTNYIITWGTSFDINFGAANASFTLFNNDGRFNAGGANEIKVGDTIELIEKFEGDSTEFKKFYGFVNKRSINKTNNNRSIVLDCLDYIAILQHLDIDLTVEGTRVKVENEVLDPVYLPSPNDSLAQLFNFANNSIATLPLPTIKITDQNHDDHEDTQYDGFEIYYDVGQLKLGSPLNVENNYNVTSTYWYYVSGVYAEDVIEEILTQQDAYGGYLFGESSAQDVIDNHLKSTYQAEEGTGTVDHLTVNSTTVTTNVESTLTQDFDGDNDTVLYLSSTQGWPDPESGQTATGYINGDMFTYTGIGSGNTLTGVSGLFSHNSGDYATHEIECDPGQVWYFKYDNITSNLTSADLDFPSGYTVQYIDKRLGKVVFTTALSLTADVSCSNYTFKTLQASGIELNKITFRKREVPNRLKAVAKVREYLAPNYIIRTQGDDKIWCSYLQQDTTADYTLDLIQKLNYMEDEDIYTRVSMWGKNENPTNIMFGDDVDYTSDEEDSYTGIATQAELNYIGAEKSGVLSQWASTIMEEVTGVQDTTKQLVEHLNETYIEKDYGSQASSGYHIFASSVAEYGKMLIGGDTFPTPIVYINGVPIDNEVHSQTAVPVKVKTKAKTVTSGGGKSKSVSSHTYYYYDVIFPHASLEPSQPIYLYDNQGILGYTIDPYDENVDYANGVWNIPGTERNDVAEVLSTASYHVFYGTDQLEIDYDEAVIKINKTICPEPNNVVVQASFEYWAISLGVKDIAAVVDGRRDTQLQLQFFGEPPANFHLATIDLGATQTIQAIDLIGGFFTPDGIRKYDIGFQMSLQSSTNGVDFDAISDKTENFRINAGEAITFDEADLGTDFEARYLKFTLQDVDRVDYGRGRYVVAMTEISAYSDIIIDTEAKLIPQTTTVSGIAIDHGAGMWGINVESTEYFEEPESGADTKTAYIHDNGTAYAFTYQALTDTTFMGLDFESGAPAAGTGGLTVTQSVESDTTLYDNDGLLQQLGDRNKQENKISDRNLFSQTELDVLAKNYLKEYYKEHSKLSATVLYQPYLKVGQTIALTDSFNNISAENYFIESLKENQGKYTITLAKYPA